MPKEAPGAQYDLPLRPALPKPEAEATYDLRMLLAEEIQPPPKEVYGNPPHGVTFTLQTEPNLSLLTDLFGNTFIGYLRAAIEKLAGPTSHPLAETEHGRFQGNYVIPFQKLKPFLETYNIKSIWIFEPNDVVRVEIDIEIHPETDGKFYFRKFFMAFYNQSTNRSFDSGSR